MSERSVVFLFGLVVVCFACSCQEGVKVGTKIPEVRGDQVLTVEQMREDLHYVVETLREVHPQTCEGFSDSQERLIESLFARIDGAMEARRFYLVVAELISSMRDGHTFLRPMKGAQNRSVNIAMRWLKDGLYVTTDCEPFRAGDRVVAIGGRASNELIEQLWRYIPSENEHYLACQSADALSREAYLEELGLIDGGQTEWTVLRGGREETLSTELFDGKVYYGIGARRHWVGYTIDEDASMGVFHLDICRWNEEYRDTVRAFFDQVSRHQIEHVVVDLRRNPGGNSHVIRELLRYLDVERYRGFGVETRHSKASAKQRGTSRWGVARFAAGKMQTNSKCPDPDLLFRGGLYVLSSPIEAPQTIAGPRFTSSTVDL